MSKETVQSKNRDVSFSRYIICLITPAKDGNDPEILYMMKSSYTKDFSKAQLFTYETALPAAKNIKMYSNDIQGKEVVLRKVMCDVDRYDLGEVIEG